MRTKQEINERIAYFQGYLRALEYVLEQYIDDTKTRVALEENMEHTNALINELKWVVEIPYEITPLPTPVFSLDKPVENN